MMKIRNNILVARSDKGSDALITAVEQKYKSNKASIRIIDIGTGSGYIALKLYEKGFYNMHASDSNKFAVNLTRENQFLNNVSFSVYHSNFFSNIPGKYDAVILNFPLCDGFYGYGIYPIKNAILGAWKAFNFDNDSFVRNRITEHFLNIRSSCARQKFINIFFQQLFLHTHESSSVFLYIHKNEIDMFLQFSHVGKIDKIDNNYIIVAMSNIKYNNIKDKRDFQNKPKCTFH